MSVCVCPPARAEKRWKRGREGEGARERGRERAGGIETYVESQLLIDLLCKHFWIHLPLIPFLPFKRQRFVVKITGNLQAGEGKRM